MSRITTHVLDAALGAPAQGVRVVLDRSTAGGWESVGAETTDSDGRIRDFGPEETVDGVYRLTFATGEYFTRSGRDTFYPEAAVTFTVDSADHYHVPLLLSPYAFSTYRGS